MKLLEHVKLKVSYLGSSYRDSSANSLVNVYDMQISCFGKEESFAYYTGIACKGTPTAEDLISSLLSEYTITLDELIYDLGYPQEKAEKVYKLIKCNNEQLDRVFPKWAIKSLQKELEDY